MPNFETSLTPDEEGEFQKWKARYAPRDSGLDYDFRGAFKAGLRPDPESGHWPDTYKKPNHPTFSDESIYAGPGAAAGHWQNGVFQPPAAAKQAMLNNSGLRDYLLGRGLGQVPDDQIANNLFRSYQDLMKGPGPLDMAPVPEQTGPSPLSRAWGSWLDFSMPGRALGKPTPPNVPGAPPPYFAQMGGDSPLAPGALIDQTNQGLQELEQHEMLQREKRLDPEGRYVPYRLLTPAQQQQWETSFQSDPGWRLNRGEYPTWSYSSLPEQENVSPAYQQLKEAMGDVGRSVERKIKPSLGPYNPRAIPMRGGGYGGPEYWSEPVHFDPERSVETFLA